MLSPNNGREYLSPINLSLRLNIHPRIRKEKDETMNEGDIMEIYSSEKKGEGYIISLGSQYFAVDFSKTTRFYDRLWFFIKFIIRGRAKMKMNEEGEC